MSNGAIDFVPMRGNRVGGQLADNRRPSPDATSENEPTANAALATRLLAVLQPELREFATCPRCDGAKLGRWGTTERGLQRWRCRECRRTCTAATGTPFTYLHSLDKLRQVAADMLADAPRSCRALAAALGLDRMTIWRWRRLIADAWADLVATEQPLDTDPAADNTVILRESRKASREWVRHQRYPRRYPAPDRLRWIDYRQQRLPLPEPMSRYEVRVALQRCACAVRRTTSGACGHLHRSPMGLPCCGRSTASIGDAAPIRPLCKSRADSPFGLATTALVASRFREFLAPFAGPATRHLRTYVTWFHARLVGTA